jgi:putative ABC transport system substrate-binding protein
MAEPVSAELNTAYLAAFRQELQRLGYIEGRNLVIEHRSTDGDASRFPALVAELIALNVDLIVARGTPAALAAKSATPSLPVEMSNRVRDAPGAGWRDCHACQRFAGRS